MINDWMFVDEEPEFYEEQIERIQKYMRRLSPLSDEYQDCVNKMQTLMELKAKNEYKQPIVSNETVNTVIKVGGMLLLGGALIFKEELIGPVTSKAVGLLTKFV